MFVSLGKKLARLAPPGHIFTVTTGNKVDAVKRFSADRHSQCRCHLYNAVSVNPQKHRLSASLMCLDAGNPIGMFAPPNQGPQLTRLVSEIQANLHQFERPPLGPFGSLLTLSDDKWAVAIEASIGRLLNQFVVHSHKDAALLRVRIITLSQGPHEVKKQALLSTCTKIAYTYCNHSSKYFPCSLTHGTLKVKLILSCKSTVHGSSQSGIACCNVALPPAQLWPWETALRDVKSSGTMLKIVLLFYTPYEPYPSRLKRHIQSSLNSTVCTDKLLSQPIDAAQPILNGLLLCVTEHDPETERALSTLNDHLQLRHASLQPGRQQNSPSTRRSAYCPQGA